MAIPSIVGDRAVFMEFTAVAQVQPIAQGEYESRYVSVMLYADPDNVGNLYIGDSARQPMKLVPGAGLSLEITTMEGLCFRGSAGDKLVVVAVVYTSLPGSAQGSAPIVRGGLGPTSRF